MQNTLPSSEKLKEFSDEKIQSIWNNFDFVLPFPQDLIKDDAGISYWDHYMMDVEREIDRRGLKKF